MPAEWSGGSSATVIMAASGYPDAAERGIPVAIPAALPEGVTVFHAATAATENGLASSGGRVLAVNAVAGTLDAALEGAYRAVDMVGFPGAVYRRDIGRRVRR